MTGTNLQSGNQSIDTSIFVVIENEENNYDFVTIDEDTLYDAIVIDMSKDDFANAIIVDFDEDASSDAFVSIIDEDQVFVSDFTADDLLFDFDSK